MKSFWGKRKSGKQNRLQEKRTLFFGTQSDGKRDLRKDRLEVSQAAEVAGPQNAATLEGRESRTEQSTQMQEKEDYRIRCPKCGKMVNRDRV